MNPSGQNQFSDIMPPGQTIPPTSGRPIIVSNQPEQTDQMLQYPAAQPQSPIAPSGPMPLAPAGIYAQPYEAPIPELPAAAQPYANYGPPTSSGIYAPSQTITPSNYAAAPVDYSQQQTPMAPAGAQVNPAEINAALAGANQPYVYHNRSLIKSIIWLTLLVFAIILFIDGILDWDNLNFLPHTHLTRL